MPKALVSVCLLLLAGCAAIRPGPGPAQWCDAYRAGHNFVVTVAFPALDRLSPGSEVSEQYLTAKVALTEVNRSIESLCAAERQDIPALVVAVSEGARLVAVISRLYGGRGDPRGSSREMGWYDTAARMDRLQGQLARSRGVK